MDFGILKNHFHHSPTNHSLKTILYLLSFEAFKGEAKYFVFLWGKVSIWVFIYEYENIFLFICLEVLKKIGLMTTFDHNSCYC